MYGDHPLCESRRLPSLDSVIGQVLWSARKHVDDSGPVPVPINEYAARLGMARLISQMCLEEAQQTKLIEIVYSMPFDTLMSVAAERTYAMLTQEG